MSYRIDIASNSLDDEQPGADLFALPRTVSIPLAVLGRALAGPSEAIQVHLLDERLDLAATHVTNLAECSPASGN